jgi:hypothetical protein
MRFLITATDISGSITLRRETAAAPLKKAAELAEDGYRDVAITTPDGRLFPSETFDRLPADGWAPNPIERKPHHRRVAERGLKAMDNEQG